VAALAAALTFAAMSAGGLGRRIELDVADLVSRLLRHEVESDIVIVGIDAESLAELDEWPWPRSHHAHVIDKIGEAAPRRLFIDVDFSSRSNPDDDARLVDAFRRWHGAPIVLPAFFQQAAAAGEADSFTQPMPPLRPYSTLASVNLLPDPDGLVRRIATGWQLGDRVLPSVPALLAGGGSATDEVWLDWSIDPRSFAYVSYADVLANRVAAEHFAGKLVFVGATAIELGDNVSVPGWRAVPGVVALAVAYESLRAGGHASLPAPLAWTLTAAWAALLAFLYCRLSWRRSLVLALAGASAVSGAALWLYAGPRVILPVVPLWLATALCFLLCTLRSLEGESFRALAYAVGIRKRDALLKSIVQSSTDAIVCLDAEGRILTANPAASTLFGCAHAVLCRTTILDCIPGLFDATRPLDELVGAVTEWEACSPATGARFPVDVAVSPILPRERGLYTAIVRDISERKAQHRQLQFQATHDALTALPNRPALAAHLDAALARSGPQGSTALLMIDLDRFKEVNDTLGHNIGDYVLYEVARRLAEVVGERGFIARIGGDEFALVVEAAHDTAALASLSRELMACLDDPVETCGISIDVGLSIGIARCPEDAEDAETLLKRADVAMYVAKKSRSGFEFYDAASDGHSIRKLTIAARLRKAIASDELTLHYQPQVNFRTSLAESAEALIRWHDPALGRVGPDEFIGLAETTDLILPLTEWTLTTALRQLAQWLGQGLDLRVAVNLSARMLQDAAFPRRMEAFLRDAGVPPRNVELEITESAMMLDPERALDVVRELHELGLLISIDDFGTGYSSLAYLRDLPVHAVKLDKSFVLNLGGSGDDRVIVESTVQMAHALGLEIIAEGVESGAVAEELARLGYDYGQGYWYSPALLPGALAAWVRQFNSAVASLPQRVPAAG
jgi:diguanylate cyclase (GGDEF)-like protein/PAS domain S-box-containing protein